MTIVPRTISGHNDWINRTDDRLKAVNPELAGPWSVVQIVMIS